MSGVIPGNSQNPNPVAFRATAQRHLWRGQSIRLSRDGVNPPHVEVNLTDVWRELLRAAATGTPCALITVIRTENSAPLAVGTVMLVTGDGNAVGSVSGGCIDSDVYVEALRVIESRVPVRRTYGTSDADEFAVGLTCGGIIEVLIQPVDSDLCDVVSSVLQRVAAHEPVSQITAISGPHAGASWAVVTDADHHPRTIAGSASPALGEAILREAGSMQDKNFTGIRTFGGGRRGPWPEEQADVFVVTSGVIHRLIIFGATDYAAALTGSAKLLGFHVTVCDARTVFATAERYPQADVVVADWPHRWLATQEVDRDTSICVLTHDPKFDVPALRIALSSNAGYVGAMGSRATHDDRVRRLLLAGATSAQLSRLHSPIGLDLGATTPAETAISILSEIIKNRNGATGQSLTGLDGPIHANSITSTSSV